MFKFKKKEKPITKSNEKTAKISESYRKENKNFPAKEMLKLYNITKPKNMFDIRGQKYKLLNKYSPLSTVFINMELTNGKRIQFITKVIDGGFKFDKGFYIIDDELKYYMETSKLWAFDYHEELCFPINRKINVNEIKDLFSGDDVELETAINPLSLQKFMESNIIQKLLAGAELDNALKFIKMGIILIGLGVLISLVILISMSGII
jgi:hypothetical protein